MAKNLTPSVAIAMATYNGQTYLKEQLESLCSQTFQDFKLVIVDDASSDDSMTIIKTFTELLNIELHQNSHNPGYIKDFEKAISLSDAPYIAPCDQDDIWLPNKLQTLLENIGNATLIYSDSKLIDAHGNSLERTLSQKLKNNFISTTSPLPFIYDNCVSAHAILFKNELKKSIFPFPKHLYFDAWIAANAAMHHGIIYVNTALICYRQHESNTLSQQKKASLSLSKKIHQKSAKKIQDHRTRTEIIDDLLKASELPIDDKNTLLQLKKGHVQFQSYWFNLSFFKTLLQHRRLLFAITKRQTMMLCFKKAIGLKLYRFLPFL